MDNSSYVALSAATALRRDLDVTANNIANASTNGFKGERVVFESYLQDGATAEENTNFVIDKGSYLDESQGGISQTGNPLDIAIQGKGWFGYRTAEGQMAFGRDGRLAVDAQGNLVTMTGAQILDEGGQPLVLPPDAVGQVEIDPQGNISAPGAGNLARIGLFDLPDLQSYERLGGGMFIPPNGGEAELVPEVRSRVVQGAIEASNVQPIVEMTRMMSIQRAYEQAVKLIGTDDELRQQTIRRLGQIT